MTAAGFDYRVLQPRLVTDANRNRTEVAFDALGMVAGTAVQGKDQTQGDRLTAFVSDLTRAQLDECVEAGDPQAAARPLLADATTRTLYDLDGFRRSRTMHPDDRTKWLPAYAATIARETHTSDALPPHGLRLQVTFSYSDGFGREIQKKVPAEPGPVVEGGPVVNPRWAGSGWTIFNNKGNPVRKYEPFFSQADRGHRFEFGVEAGVSTSLFYDPLGRIAVTLNPNHTYEKVVFDAWTQRTFDANDTVAPHGGESGDPRTDPDIGGYVERYFASRPAWKSWFELRASNGMGPRERSAAAGAALHANTPSTVYLDVLGRTFLTVAETVMPDGRRVGLPSRAELDIEGNRLAIRDAVLQNGDARGRVVMRNHYDMLGNRIHQASMEAGERWTLIDVLGKPIRAWDSTGRMFRSEYDGLRRTLRTIVRQSQDGGVHDAVTERVVYGEQHPESEPRNLRGATWLAFDQAGVVISDERDFKGNLLRSARRLARQVESVIDWSPMESALVPDAQGRVSPATVDGVVTPLLEAERFVSRTAYDALNRAVRLIPPHRADAGTRTVVQPVFNDANLLERVDVWLDAAAEPAGFLDRATTPVSPVGVENIDYNAKGQRLRIEYQNGAILTYTHDPDTFRLSSLVTRRAALLIADLHYTYDPAGNITSIRDEAQQAQFFQNQVVEAQAEYVYDALYRLIAATGRERLSGAGNASSPHSADDAARAGIRLSANRGDAIGSYVEEYDYDDAGNLITMTHRGSNPAHPGWSRTFVRDEASQIEPGKRNNRLTNTSLGGAAAVPEPYLHDVHGNVVRMPHLGPGADAAAPNLHWDDKDQLRRVDLGGGGTAWYVYDASGQRTRKVWRKSPGLVEERVYLGGCELFRRRDGAGAVTLERETLHVMDDKQRIALVETRTIGNDPAPARQVRYQLGNHLGSVVLELDEPAQIISLRRVQPLRQHYVSSGAQRARDAEALPLHGEGAGRGKRPLLPRREVLRTVDSALVSCDPASFADGLNLYRYVSGNPIGASDPSGMSRLADLTKDLNRVNRATSILMPSKAMAEGAVALAVAVKDKAAEAITGQSHDNGKSQKLTVEQRVGAATDAIISATPLAPVHHVSKAISKATVKAIKGESTKAEAALEIAKTEPTGLVSKAAEAEENLEKASSAGKKGDTANKVRGYVDAGLSFMEFMNIGVSLGMGSARFGPGGGGAGGGKPPAGSGGPSGPGENPFAGLSPAEIESAVNVEPRAGQHYRTPVEVSETPGRTNFDDLVPVSRWGKPGLRPNDWVMAGDPTKVNYWRSFKWENPSEGTRQMLKRVGITTNGTRHRNPDRRSGSLKAQSSGRGRGKRSRESSGSGSTSLSRAVTPAMDPRRRGRS